MQRANSTGFFTKDTFQISNQTNDTAKLWEKNHMYETSYLKMSQKNVIIFIINFLKANAMKNSTEIILQTKSSRLREISPQNQYYVKALENTDFINHDYKHHYRTSYGDMSFKVKYLV